MERLQKIDRQHVVKGAPRLRRSIVRSTTPCNEREKASLRKIGKKSLKREAIPSAEFQSEER